MEQNQRHLTKPLIKYPEGQTPAQTIVPPRKSPEEKKYYILVHYKDDIHDPTWKECFGRTEAVHEARLYTMENADLERSVVFVEGVTVDPEVTLYWFLKKMEDLFPDSSFDVDEYMMGDPESTVAASVTDIPVQVSSFLTDEDPDTGDRDI